MDVKRLLLLLAAETLGPSMLDPSLGPNDVAFWSPFGTNTKAQVGDYVEITHVDNLNGAVLFLRNTLGLTADLVIGRRYRIAGEAKVSAGSASILVSADAAYTTTVTSTSYVPFEATFTATAPTTNFIRFVTGGGSGQIVTGRITAFNQVLG